MLVFLGCSGERSKAVAEAFSTWIRQVIQAVDPWISSDIDKGARWMEEVAAKLEEARLGIVCLTKENLKEEWILFETGAIAKMKDARPCTLLLDIASADVEQPLGIFQHTTARNIKDVRKLLHTINKAVERCGEKALDESVLNRVFETNWPELLGALDQIVSQQPASVAIERTEKEMLQEVLEILRGQERRIGQGEKSTVNHLRNWLIDNKIRRALEPNAELKNALATMNFDSIVSEKVAKYLAEGKHGGILSSDFLQDIEEKDADDEKKQKGSGDEGEKDD